MSQIVELTHDHPRGVHIKIVAEALTKERHGLDLLYIRDGE